MVHKFASEFVRRCTFTRGGGGGGNEYAVTPGVLRGPQKVEAGVPAKMSTRENAHLSILRPRTLIRRQNSPVRRSRENVHQPRIWTPNSLHFAHAVHFAHGGQNLLLSFDCKSD